MKEEPFTVNFFISPLRRFLNILMIIEMKKFFLLAVMCAVCGINYAQENKADAPEGKTNPVAPKETAVFNKTEHDFGTIPENGGNVECEFTVKNTGNTPLTILKATPSCGCTVAEFTQEPIAPGKKGTIKASFNPKGNKNEFGKQITVFTDGNPARTTLTIKGKIKQ